MQNMMLKLNIKLSKFVYLINNEELIFPELY